MIISDLIDKITDDEFINVYNESNIMADMVRKIGYAKHSHPEVAKKINERILSLGMKPFKPRTSKQKIDRELAIEKGHKYYFTGLECENGHKSVRYTANGVCLECSRNRNKNISLKQRLKIINYQTHRRSKQKQYKEPCEITLEFLLEIYPKDGRCPVLDIPFEFGGPRHSSPSLDRFDTTIGYTKDNVHFISSKANTMKWNSTDPYDHIKLFLYTRYNGHTPKLQEEDFDKIKEFIDVLVKKNMDESSEADIPIVSKTNIRHRDENVHDKLENLEL